MILVSGAPRSRTSTMMRFMIAAFGEERVLGDKWPTRMAGKEPDPDAPDPTLQQEGETDGEFVARSYLREKKKLTDEQEAKRDKQKQHIYNMNPNGYYEMTWCVRGIRYTPAWADEYKNAKVGPLKVVKVVSSGLSSSPPDVISKVVFMARDPREVAKSQEDLRGRFPNDEDPEANGKKVAFRSVGGWVRDTTLAARWFLANPEVPVHVVDCDALVVDLDGAAAAVAEFLDEDGDWEAAKQVVDTRPRGAKPDVPEDDPDLVALSLELHALVIAYEWQAVVDRVEAYAEQKKQERLANPQEPEQVLCTRIGTPVSKSQCERCQSKPVTVVNMVKTSIRKKIDWVAEPCIREVVRGEATVDESILQNHWLKVVQ